MSRMLPTRHDLTQTFTKTIHLQYLQYLPATYGSNPDKKWPLILFLHGSGERGDDLEKVKLHGIPKVIDDLPDFSFILIAPQCPEDTRWECELDALDCLLKRVVEDLAIDEDRIIVTGLSMGGTGTWALAAKFPERFAAIVPICGFSDPRQAPKIKQIPVWIFHGADDTVVPIERSDTMYTALKESGGSPQFTIYNGRGHDAWEPAYTTPELYEWMVGQSRKDRK